MDEKYGTVRRYINVIGVIIVIFVVVDALVVIVVVDDVGVTVSGTWKRLHLEYKGRGMIRQ